MIFLSNICYMFSDMLAKKSHIFIHILDILKIGYIEYYCISEDHKRKQSFTQYMPLAVPGKHSADCEGNYNISETTQ